MGNCPQLGKGPRAEGQVQHTMAMARAWRLLSILSCLPVSTRRVLRAGFITRVEFRAVSRPVVLMHGRGAAQHFERQ